MIRGRKLLKLFVEITTDIIKKSRTVYLPLPYKITFNYTGCSIKIPHVDTVFSLTKHL